MECNLQQDLRVNESRHKLTQGKNEAQNEESDDGRQKEGENVTRITEPVMRLIQTCM